MNPPRSARPRPRSGYAATLRYLYGLQYRGIKVGLRNIRALTAFTDHPERTFPCFHLAGTNGKGSTASFLASILTEAGYRTGLYTSPHLVNFTERIRIDGVPIPEAALVQYTDTLRPVIEKTGATFFEVTTCIAFQYFADQKVDVAVVETGLGGRLDATNVVMPLVSIITNIGLDHQEILGNSVRSIAREKAGIIKSGSPVVTMAEGEALDVIRQTARRRRTPLFLAEDVVQISVAGTRAGASIISLRSDSRTVSRARLGVPGDHQVKNAALAVASLSLVKSRGLFGKAGPDAIRRGLARVNRNTGLRARMELIRTAWADVYVDVGHNPEGIQTVAESFLKRKMRFGCAVFGAMRDKDTSAMLEALAACAETIVIVRPRTPRAATVVSLMRKGRQLGLDVRRGGDVVRGIKTAQSLVHTVTGERPPRILIIGSHFLAGEALSALEKNS